MPPSAASLQGFSGFLCPALLPGGETGVGAVTLIGDRKQLISSTSSSLSNTLRDSIMDTMYNTFHITQPSNILPHSLVAAAATQPTVCMEDKDKINSRYVYRNLKRSPSTPIAVTAAPAPAPCTINGRAPYRSVWNMTMLSDPPSEVTKGCVLGYLPKSCEHQNLP